MILEMVILFQITAIVLFGIAYKKRDEILWAISLVLSGALAFISANIGFHTFAIGANNVPGLVMFSYDSIELKAVNLGIFLISLIYFFIDLFANHWPMIKEKVLRKKKKW